MFYPLVYDKDKKKVALIQGRRKLCQSVTAPRRVDVRIDSRARTNRSASVVVGEQSAAQLLRSPAGGVRIRACGEATTGTFRL